MALHPSNRLGPPDGCVGPTPLLAATRSAVGSVPLSSMKITTSLVTRWPLSNVMREVIRTDLLPESAPSVPGPSMASRAGAFCGARSRCCRIVLSSSGLMRGSAAITCGAASMMLI